MNIPNDTQTPWAGLRCWVYADLYAPDIVTLHKKMKNFQEKWPPQGYDTKIKIAPHNTGKGYYHMQFEHYSTCS